MRIRRRELLSVGATLPVMAVGVRAGAAGPVRIGALYP